VKPDGSEPVMIQANIKKIISCDEMLLLVKKTSHNLTKWDNALG